MHARFGEFTIACLGVESVTFSMSGLQHQGKKRICHTTPGRENVLLVGWRMGSDLGKGFIVMLLSCDLHMIQPL